jgi:dTDP-4-dehydrorhamnose reductase
MKQIRNGSKQLFVVNDKDGTPTYTYDFVRTVMTLITKEYWGLYNCVCKGQTSRLEVATELVSILGLSNEITVTGVTSDYFKHEYFAARPSSEALISKKLQLRQIDLMRDWKIALREYIKSSYEGYLLS